MNTTSKSVLGMAAAALAGVAIGLLVAPRSGEEMRQTVTDQANGYAKKLLKKVRKGSNMVEDISDDASNYADVISDKANKVREKVENFVDDTVDSTKATYNQAKGYAKAEYNRAQNQVEKVG